MDDIPEAEICGACRTAVLRTYREMRGQGEDEVSAFRTALRVLALRHPERSAGARTALLIEWLEAG